MSRDIASLSGEWPDGTLYAEITDNGKILFWMAGDGDAEFINVHMAPEDAHEFARLVVEAADAMMEGSREP